MSTEQNSDQENPEARSKALMVLGLTFILPIILTLIAVWIYI
ncbi:MAG TPA: hypothetical protein VF412_07885 [Bdellovibrio sp.]